MAKRQVFFSFHYNRDSWRASQVRNMGKVDGNSTFSDNDWEEVRYKSDTKIKEWIDKQLAMRSCLVVLVGYVEKPCVRDPRSPVPLTLAVQNSLTL